MLTVLFILLTGVITLAGIPAWRQIFDRLKRQIPVIPRESESTHGTEGVWVLVACFTWLGSQLLSGSVFLAAIGVSAADAAALTTTQLGMMMLVTGTAQLVALAAVTAAAIFHTNDARGLGWRLERWTVDIKVAGVCFLVATPVIMLMQSLLTLLVPYSHPVIQAIIESRDLFTVAAVAFSAVIAAPIGEEIVFRGFVQNWLQKYLRGWQPIVITSAIFALAHLGHGLGPITLFGFSLVLGYLFRQTGSLLPCIALHMLNNGYSVFWLVIQVAFGETASVP